MDSDKVPLGSLVELQVGGLWGDEAPSELAPLPVRVIRGVDAWRLANGEAFDLPVRWVSERVLAKRRLSRGDLVIEASGECGRSYLVTDRLLKASEVPLSYSNFCRRLVVNEGVDSQYVAAVVRAAYSTGALAAFKNGTAIQNLDVKAMLLGLLVPRPGAEIQTAIGDVFGRINEILTMELDIMKALDDCSWALFESQFKDQSLVLAKKGDSAPHAGLAHARPSPDPAEAAWSESISREWPVAPLATIAELMVGGDWGSDSQGADSVEVRCLRGVDLDRIRRYGYANAPLRYVSRNSLEKRAPSDVDVLVEGSGRCGRSLAYQHLGRVFSEPIIYSNFCKRFRCPTPAVAYYVEYLLNDMVKSGQMRAFITGTAMPNLDHKALLESHLVPVPTPEALQKFADVADATRRRLFGGAPQPLALLRERLLSDLWAGQLALDRRPPVR